MTNRQQLNRLKEPYRSQAILNAELLFSGTNNILDEETDYIETAIINSFDWSKTASSSQGFDYWDDIHNNPQNYLEDESKN